MNLLHSGAVSCKIHPGNLLWVTSLISSSVWNTKLLGVGMDLLGISSRAWLSVLILWCLIKMLVLIKDFSSGGMPIAPSFLNTFLYDKEKSLCNLGVRGAGNRASPPSGCSFFWWRCSKETPASDKNGLIWSVGLKAVESRYQTPFCLPLIVIV